MSSLQPPHSRAPFPRTTINDLSPEIIIPILDFVRQSDPPNTDRPTSPLRNVCLTSCALVCSSWRSLTLPLLWEDLILTTTHRHFYADFLVRAHERAKVGDRVRRQRLQPNSAAPSDPDNQKYGQTYDYAGFVRRMVVNVGLASNVEPDDVEFVHPLSGALRLFGNGQLRDLMLDEVPVAFGLVPSSLVALLQPLLSNNLQSFSIDIASWSVPFRRGENLLAIFSKLPPSLTSFCVENDCKHLGSDVPHPKDSDFSSPYKPIFTLPKLAVAFFTWTCHDIPKPLFLQGIRTWSIHLQYLSLFGCFTVDADVIETIAATCPNLSYLYVGFLSRLCRPYITPEFEIAMCRLVRTCRRLTSLSWVADEAITDAFLLCCATEGPPRLRRLNLDGLPDKITGKGVTQVPAWAELEDLKVGDQHMRMEDEFVDAVRRGCPNLMKWTIGNWMGTCSR
ncbi:hypothetical protein BC936DRAFT_145154 [Jimgerdemannia flammicorona]|uniref:Uncharacterized protein n=1 Tax=Jimgerdemannia flammicorona TaxID=994334 RepID=A0A433DAS7_9FUNG|nr:hypothetical protein BC936DRAFT_145154 [Jimgerdemannia flammicorona]